TMALTSFSLKIASRCNLNCVYCYVYNKGDFSWKTRPPVMPEDVFCAAIDRIHEYCRRHGRDRITLVFHGGEPTLVGIATLRRWCKYTLKKLVGITPIFSIQTNGTLLTDGWAELFR